MSFSAAFHAFSCFWNYFRKLGRVERGQPITPDGTK